MWSPANNATDRDGEQNDLDAGRRAELPQAILAETRGQSPGRRATREKTGDREQRSDHRQPVRPGGREAEKDNVAGHVRDEHVTELQVRDGIDDAGDDRQQDHQRGQRPVRASGRRP
jgi:hypothetical protein